VFFDSFANLLGPHSCLFQWPTRDFVATRAYIQARLKARFPVPEVNDVFDMKKIKDLTLLQPLRLVCKASKNAVDIQIKRIYANVNKQDTQAVKMFHEKEIDVILQEEQENKKLVQKMMHFMLHEFTQETIITKLSCTREIRAHFGITRLNDKKACIQAVVFSMLCPGQANEEGVQAATSAYLALMSFVNETYDNLPEQKKMTRCFIITETDAVANCVHLLGMTPTYRRQQQEEYRELHANLFNMLGMFQRDTIDMQKRLMDVNAMHIFVRISVMNDALRTGTNHNSSLCKVYTSKYVQVMCALCDLFNGNTLSNAQIQSASTSIEVYNMVLPAPHLISISKDMSLTAEIQQPTYNETTVIKEILYAIQYIDDFSFIHVTKTYMLERYVQTLASLAKNSVNCEKIGLCGLRLLLRMTYHLKANSIVQQVCLKTVNVVLKHNQEWMNDAQVAFMLPDIWPKLSTVLV